MQRLTSRSNSLAVNTHQLPRIAQVMGMRLSGESVGIDALRRKVTSGDAVFPWKVSSFLLCRDRCPSRVLAQTTS